MRSNSQPSSWLRPISLAAFFFISGLALSRLAYEGFFPRLLWLARPMPALLMGLGTATLGALLWRRDPGQPSSWRNAPLVTWSPLLLNLLYLWDPAVDLLRSHIIFAASLWLTAALLALRSISMNRWTWAGVGFLWLALAPIYLLTMSRTVGGADTFEFQVVAPNLGIAHPTGYPLYLMLGKLFSLIPGGSPAWRLNLASAVFALMALSLLFLTLLRLWKRPLPSLMAVTILGMSPTFWSQAIVAEVYALHALLVAAVLWLLVFMIVERQREHNWQLILGPWGIRFGWRRQLLALAFLLGLSLTNHLTSLFLLPPALMTLLLAHGSRLRLLSLSALWRLALQAALLFALPLLLYLYLPLRWYVVLEESMGWRRFIDWVVAGRFRGALQWMGWWRDVTRYEIVGRLLLRDWGMIYLLVALLGLLYAFLRSWRAAVVLALLWLGFTFYALNYYVPDLAVFLTATHVATTIFWAGGATFLVSFGERLAVRVGRPGAAEPSGTIVLLLLLLPLLLSVADRWRTQDQSQDDGLTQWGRGVLSLPLEAGAAILADSEKVAPLYYLQQAEGLRPDLEIMVLPDEAAYRAELEGRVAAGQPLYLARFLPGLEGIYHLRSQGSLLEVSDAPLTSLPPAAVEAGINIGPLYLAGYQFEPQAKVDENASAVTFYWQAAGSAQAADLIYVRWSDGTPEGAQPSFAGQHPAGNFYPVTNAMVPNWIALSPG